MTSGLAGNIVDPDGGVNLQKKRLSLGLDKEVVPLTDEHFPDSGFQVGISAGIPQIGYSQIWKYLIEDVELKKQLSVEKPIVKGYNFYKSGKVLGVYSKAENNMFYLKSHVMPSYSKTGPVYAVKFIVRANSSISKAYCPCPAGIDGRCNHLAATLFAIEDMGRKLDTAKQSESASDVPCTSKPCAWSVPRRKPAEATTIQSVTFEKHIWGKTKRKRDNSSCDDIEDVRAPHQRTQDRDFQVIFEKIKQIEQKTGKKIGLSTTIPHRLPENPPEEDKEGNEDTEATKWKVISPLKHGPLSLTDIANRAFRTKKRLFDSSNDIEAIAKDTLEQHKTSTWFDVRQPRITASKCKRCLLKPTTSPTKAISEVLMHNKQVQTKAMKEGIELEPEILKKFEEKTGYQVTKSGFLISETHPFLGASPDGLIGEDHTVEVKKLVLKEGETLEDAMCRQGIYKKVETGLVINKNHKYFFQMQQQLYCSKRHSCYFIVSDGTNMHSDLIAFDEAYQNETVPRLEHFYFECVFPEIVYPRILHGETRWNKDLQFPSIS